MEHKSLTSLNTLIQENYKTVHALWKIDFLKCGCT
jgi:hypothetical protein